MIYEIFNFVKAKNKKEFFFRKISFLPLITLTYYVLRTISQLGMYVARFRAILLISSLHSSYS